MQSKIFLYLLLLISIVGLQKADAQSGYTLTWTGGSSNWNNSASWIVTPGGVSSFPGNYYNDDAVVINNSITTTITANFPDQISGGGNTATGNSIYSLAIGPGVTVNLVISGIPYLKVTNSISIGAGSTLNIIGPGDITGTSVITLNNGATLTTTGGAQECDIAAASLSASNYTTKNTTVTLGGNLVLSGALTVNQTGTTTLTTNGLTNSITGGVVVNNGGSSTTLGNLTWNGSGTTIVGTSTTGPCTINAGCLFTVGAGNNIKFLDGLNLQGNTPLVATLNNSGNLTFSACSLSGSGLTAAATAITNVNGGTITLTASASSQINIPQNVILSNSGTITANSGSSINLNNATSTFINNASGLVTVIGSGATGANVNLSANPSTLTNNGTMNFTVNSALNLTGANATATSTGTMLFDASTLLLKSNPTSFTNSGISNTLTFQNSSSLKLSGANSVFTNSSPNAYFNSSTITMGSNPDNISNTGNMYLTSTQVNFTAQSEVFANAANLFLVASPFLLTGSSGQFNNTGTVQASGGSNFTLGTNTNTGSSINNNGSSASFLYSGGTILFSGNSTSLNNSGLFQATGGTTFDFTATGSPGGSIINNTGATFNVGTDGSTNTIILEGTGGTNTVTNNGAFNIGPLCTIDMTSTAAKVNNVSGTFTLYSTAAGSATIGTIASGATCTGLFNVQRYITGGSGYRGYRMLTSPVNINSLTVQTAASPGYIALDYLNTGMLTGGPGTGFDVVTTNPLTYFYNETRTENHLAYIAGKNVGVNAITGSSGTPPYSITTYGTTLASTTAGVRVPVGNSYQIYFVGNTSNTTSSPVPNAAMVTAVGYLNQGTIPVNIFNGATSSTTMSYTTGTGAATPGFQQLGNPYASTIFLDNVYADNAGAISPFFWELAEPGNTFVSYNASTHAVSSSSAGAYIVSGQGFFVVANGAGQSFNFKESEKFTKQLVAGGTPPLLLDQRLKSTNSIAAAEALPTGLTGLHLQIAKDTATYTQTGIYFSSSWSDKFNPMEDAVDLDGTAPQVFLSSYSSDNTRLCINQLGDYSKGKRVKLYASATTSGTYTISLADIKNIDALYNVYLRDHKLNDSVNLRSTNAYTFTINTGDTSTYGANRFDLVLEREALPPYQLLTFTGQKVSSGVQLNWVANGTGNYTGFALEKEGANNTFSPIYTVQSSNNNSNYNFVDNNPVVGNNIYRLAQNDVNGNVSYSSLITIGYNSVSSNGYFSVYPNPSKDMINILVNSTTATAANYTADIYNTSGVLMDHRILNTYSWTEDISSYKEGVYIIALKDANGEVLAKSKFIKTK